MKTQEPEEILNECIVLDGQTIREFTLKAMDIYGKQQYNQGVFDCIENATTECTSTCIRVDKESMKKLLKT